MFKKNKTKKKKKHRPVKECVPDENGLTFFLFLFFYCFFFFFFFFFFCLFVLFCFYCKHPDETVRMLMLAHAHADLELFWSYVFLDAGPYSLKFFFFFFYCKYLKTLIRLHRYMLIHSFADQIFLGDHFMFHLSFLLQTP